MLRCEWNELRDRNEARCARILANSEPLVLDDLDWSSPPEGLESDVIDALVYMRDVEGYTDRELVGLTAHRDTLADPLIREFLDLWRAEESGHARALSRFLDWYAGWHDVSVPAQQGPPPAVASVVERLVAATGGPVGDTVTAAHMTWGAANELLTLNGYRLLAARTRVPLLRQLLGRIANQEARHYSFYLLQAEWRLAASPLVRAVIRQVLRRAWTPVGVGDGYKSPGEFRRLLDLLGADEAGRRVISRMDQRFSGLPGLDGLRIYAGLFT